MGHWSLSRMAFLVAGLWLSGCAAFSEILPHTHVEAHEVSARLIPESGNRQIEVRMALLNPLEIEEALVAFQAEWLERVALIPQGTSQSLPSPFPPIPMRPYRPVLFQPNKGYTLRLQASMPLQAGEVRRLKLLFDQGGILEIPLVIQASPVPSK